tara:strand:- start:5710 stop:6768 length:1059 start_codon:yes stop_codon:yes gene_type:complete
MVQRNLTKIAYQTLQQGKSIAGFAHKELSNRIMDLISPSAQEIKFDFDEELLQKLQESMSELREIDWRESEENLYPQKLLFEGPWLKWFMEYPKLWLDMPLTWKRRQKGNYRDMPKKIDKEFYPDYYLQNFHHQTDGYLSEYSASIYDLQVEILFNGTADSMRRRVISPLKRGLEVFTKDQLNSLKVLDIAAGTGRTLKQLRSAFPNLNLYGIDLSSSYLKEASRYLSSSEGNLVELIQGNAESLPYEDNTFNGITCVYLFHELPSKVREKVIEECYRVLKPKGIFVLADSIQIKDSPDFISIMENFHKNFHEPYYRDYIRDNIVEKLSKAGFQNINGESFFMTRVWSCYKA